MNIAKDIIISSTIEDPYDLNSFMTEVSII